MLRLRALVRGEPAFEQPPGENGGNATNTMPISASSQSRARCGSGRVKKSTRTLEPRSWQ